jgi:hypothetical protein
MDIVYLNTQTKWNCNEIKFSIRSAEKFLSFDKLFIVGYLPEFINQKAIHIPFEDIGDKFDNVDNKMKLILLNDRISEDFILMNDDFILLKEYKTIPYYYKEELIQAVENSAGRYKKRLERTLKLFPGSKSFEMHFPIVFNKTKLSNLFKKYGTEIEKRSAYCSEYKVQKTKHKDHKIWEYEQFDKKAPFISFSDGIKEMDFLQNFVCEKLPDPSSFEKSKESEVKERIEHLEKIFEIYKKKNPLKYETKKEELKQQLLRIKHGL